MVKDGQGVRFSEMWIVDSDTFRKRGDGWMNLLKCLPVLVRGVVCDFFLG